MIRRGLLRVVNRLARRRDERIVKVGDMLTMVGAARTPFKVDWESARREARASEDRLTAWYLRGSDE